MWLQKSPNHPMLGAHKINPSHQNMTTKKKRAALGPCERNPSNQNMTIVSANPIADLKNFRTTFKRLQNNLRSSKDDYKNLRPALRTYKTIQGDRKVTTKPSDPLSESFPNTIKIWLQRPPILPRARLRISSKYDFKIKTDPLSEPVNRMNSSGGPQNMTKSVTKTSEPPLELTE